MRKSAIIAALRAGQLSITEIARREGVSKGYVCILRNQCGIAYRCRPWSPEEIAELRALRSRRLPYAEIARRIGRTKNAARNAALRFRAAAPRSAKCGRVDKQELRRLVKAGRTDAEVAATFGVHLRTVRWHRQRLGLAANRRHRKWTAAELETAARILSGGGSIREAARAVGRTMLAVRHALLRHTTEGQ